jgi:hypothetical protein
MPDGLRIEVRNYSHHEWERNNWHIGAGQEEGVNWTAELTQTPSQRLAKDNGMTVVAADQAWLTSIVRNNLYTTLGYGSSEGSWAVHVQQQFHLFTIGKGCEWRVWDKDWKYLGTDSSEYIWTFKTCRVVATPTLANTSASVSVVITGLPK